MTQAQEGQPGSPERVLAVFAHPDDIELTSGGTIAKFCAEGKEVYYVLVTSGDKGSHDENMTSEQLAAIREEEQRNAARVLGVKECVFLRYPDGFVEDTAELRGKLVRLIRQFKPDIVITWDGFRRSFNHRDHRIVGQVTADAVMPLARSHLYFPEHMAEGLQPHRVRELLMAGSDQANYYVDIKDYLDIRIEAALCHVSQMRGRTREEFQKMWQERAEQALKEGRYPYAEAFRRMEFRRDEGPRGGTPPLL